MGGRELRADPPELKQNLFSRTLPALRLICCTDGNRPLGFPDVRTEPKNKVCLLILQVIERMWSEMGHPPDSIVRYRDLADPELVAKLEEEARACNGFDLIAGGTPCNNFSGSNRGAKEAASGRSGLNGKHSRIFYNFAEICRRMVDVYNELWGVGKVEYYA